MHFQLILQYGVVDVLEQGRLMSKKIVLFVKVLKKTNLVMIAIIAEGGDMSQKKPNAQTVKGKER